MIQIPNQLGQVTQSNRSDVKGNIVSSFNIDLTSNVGKIKASPRLLSTSTSASVATLTSPASNFVRFDGEGGVAFRLWATLGTAVHISSTGAYLNGTWAIDSSGTTPTVESGIADINTFGSNLWASTSTALYKRVADATAWTLITNHLSSGLQKIVEPYNNRLYYNYTGTGIRSLDSSDTVANMGGPYTMSITDEFQIYRILAGRNKLWILTIGYGGGKGCAIYEWDGVSTSPNVRYPIPAEGIASGVLKDDVAYVIDTNGILRVFNGSSFVEIDRLPLHGKLLAFDANSTARFIHPRGMAVIDNRICLLINNLLGDNSGTIAEKCPSGIWELGEDNKLYHKHSITYTGIGTSTITDYGQIRLSSVGALKEIRTANSNSGANGTFICSATYYTNASSTATGIFTDDSNDTVQKGASFVTSEMYSANLTDNWQKIYTQMGKLLNSADKIVVKYRENKQDPTEMTITWLNSTSFTTTDANIANYAVGDEVEVTQGTGGGMCGHIISITNNAGTYTVGVDESFPVTTGTAKARVQKWTKAGTFSGTTDNLAEFSIGVPAPRIQIKVFMLFTGKNELERVTVVNKPDRKFE